MPAGDRTYLVLAKPNVIMNVEGDGLGALMLALAPHAVADTSDNT